MMDTEKPVIIVYQTDTEPTADHPNGHLSGETYEVRSPEAAMVVHPDARILRYADGSEYSEAKAKRDIRERDRVAESETQGKAAKKAASASKKAARTQDTKSGGKARPEPVQRATAVSGEAPEVPTFNAGKPESTDAGSEG